MQPSPTEQKFNWTTEPYRRNDRAKVVSRPGPCLLRCHYCKSPTTIQTLALPRQLHTVIHCGTCHAHALAISSIPRKRRSMGTPGAPLPAGGLELAPTDSNDDPRGAP